MSQPLATQSIIASFTSDLQAYVMKYAEAWQTCGTRIPESALTFTPAAQQSNGRLADLLIDSMERDLQRYPGCHRDQPAWRRRMLSTLRRIAAESLRFADGHLDIIFSPEYFKVTREFARQARAFDPKIADAALGQALRNVWVMNFLQLVLGRKPSLSPSIFAYSMLYPYTDNYIDQPGVPRHVKEAACARLGRRLEGWSEAPVDAREVAVFHLIGMIERGYARDLFPGVYSSLLAIHAGQVQSLRQQHQRLDLGDHALLRISVEKGGSSVLADGWLVAGVLSPAEAEAFFALGVLLQLLDDLQDFLDDREAGHWTLFTRTASRESLDGLTSRLWNFMEIVLRSTPCFGDSDGRELGELLRRNCTLLMLRSIAECPGLYSPGYLCHMERFSPLAFGFLNERRRTIGQKFSKIWPALARRRGFVSIFDLLC